MAIIRLGVDYGTLIEAVPKRIPSGARAKSGDGDARTMLTLADPLAD